MEGLFGDYDALANSMAFMATSKGTPMRHIVYSKEADNSYRAIATIDAMPNANMAVTWMEGEEVWRIVQRQGNQVTQHRFAGPRKFLFDYLQGLCEKLEA